MPERDIVGPLVVNLNPLIWLALLEMAQRQLNPVSV